ncbi:MAG: hypothetical protein ACE5J4_01775 [Candidatus Aenigmatarchaeota archaeon]
MKGFIYLVEIVVASILIAIVLGIFFSTQTIKLNWERSDLIAIGDNIFYVLKNSDKINNLINNDFNDIEKIRPPNVEYGLKIVGTPKNNIIVGCYNSPSVCNYLEEILTQSYLNGRWISFDVQSYDSIYDTSIDNFDSLIFVDQASLFSDSSFRGYVKNFLDDGGVVIAINSINSNTPSEFLEFFNLTFSPSSALSNLYFETYNPKEEKIEKYFLGFGFDINFKTTENTYWYIWEQKRLVKFSTPSSIIIQGVGILYEGDTFSLYGPDGKSYGFKVKKIFYPQKVFIQPLDTNFVFKDFSEHNVKGNNIVVNVLKSYAGMTKNYNAIWISDFPNSDEYRTLVKSALGSRINEWSLKEFTTEKETVTISYFTSTCCDIPEIVEIILILWYRF